MLLTLLTASLPLISPHPRPAQEPLACVTMNTANLPLATRQSPLDSISFTVGTAKVKVCYGRPSAKGRTMIGGTPVPFGKLWRTGANEPTMIHTTGPITVAGIAVPAGSYSLYTIPGEKEWHVIVNRSISQWGHEGRYTPEVKAQELTPHGTAQARAMAQPVEMFTIRSESHGNMAHLILEWEKTRVEIPIGAGK